MKVGVLLVAFGAVDLLEQALRPVTELPIVVVDNSSLAVIRELCGRHGVPYVDPGRNLGFAAGVNLGFSELRRQHGPLDVLVLNPDAVVSTGQIERLHQALRAVPRRAAVAPALAGPEGPQRVAWPFPAPARMWRESLGLLGTSRHDADWLVGAALLISAEAYQEIGPFDERFFLYCEETDWQRRAVMQGWSVELVQDVVVEHVGAGTSSDPAWREALFHAGNETYIRKWFGDRGWASYRLAALAGAAGRSLLPGARGAAAKMRVRLYLRGPRRAAGLD